MSAIDKLVSTVARLRAPDGCPWDREQTHQSLCDCLIEEVAELLETIDRDDLPHMREELGDLLLQVVMHAQMAEEHGAFSFDDVAREVNEKMVRRHPHVFGNALAEDSDAVLRQWDEIKAQEKKSAANTAYNNGAGTGETLFKEAPPTLSSLLRARDVWKVIRKKNLPEPAAPTTFSSKGISSLAKELDEAAAGAKLFEIVAACREAGIDPESALRRHTGRVMDAVTAETKKGI
ncbi:MAG: MazG family protein [Puniceicoccales bacterium]|jgi:XTP/dITP diphosphohydrolase/tetrapyrrole methylase family protein/MazG family protein|nr:MazG family protein [Puniceicoccales bacterium]